MSINIISKFIHKNVENISDQYSLVYPSMLKSFEKRLTLFKPNVCSTDEFKSLSQKRNKIVSELLEMGFLNLSMGNKLTKGTISKGCASCMAGKWSCIFTSLKCNLSCSFCPGPQNQPIEHTYPTLQGGEFKTPRELVNFVKKRKDTGMAFSGGEPLLVLDRVINIIKLGKKEIGPQLYTWIYTNGYLVTPENLQELKNAGLDEIRFDLAARDYDTTPIKLARQYIKFVTVETPAIPKEINKFKKALIELNNIGINQLNLHELLVTPYNYDKQGLQKSSIIVRDKHLLHRNFSVAGSELTALKLAKFCAENSFKFSINICTNSYKINVQQPLIAMQNAKICKKEWQEVTVSGFLKSVISNDTRVESHLKSKGISKGFKQTEGLIEMHSKVAEKIDLNIQLYDLLSRANLRTEKYQAILIRKHKSN